MDSAHLRKRFNNHFVLAVAIRLSVVGLFKRAVKSPRRFVIAVTPGAISRVEMRVKYL
jgi:hypothetical protein